MSKHIPMCACVCREVDSERGFDATCQVFPVDSSCLVVTDPPKILSHPSSQLSCFPFSPESIYQRGNETMDPASLQVSSSSSNLMVNQSDGDQERERVGPAGRCRVVSQGVSTAGRTGEIDFELLSMGRCRKNLGWCIMGVYIAGWAADGICYLSCEPAFQLCGNKRSKVPV